MHDVLARIIAQREGRAFPIVSLYELLPDSAETFAIAPIHVVAEELIQAVAFGPLDSAPQIVVEHHPLSRRSQFLEPLAQALEAYLQRAVISGWARIYLPHEAALESLALLGARFEHNREASDTIRRLGYLCRTITDMAEMPGQQFVVVMTNAIRAHVVTGQSPAKDGHLRSLTTWLDPVPGTDVAQEADRAALVATAGILDQRSDERVEMLRNLMRRRPRQADGLRTAIENIQRAGAQADWTALVDAHEAFWGLGLGQNIRFNAQMSDDIQRLAFRLGDQRARASRTIAMSRLFDDRVLGLARHEAARVDADERHFVRTRQRGRAFLGTIGSVTFLRRRNQRPCEITVDVETQPLLRVRPGTRVRAVDSRLAGTVRSLVRDQQTGRYSMVVNVSQAAAAAQLGASHRWVEGQVLELQRAKGLVYTAVERRRPPLVFDPELAAAPGRVDASVDLLAIVRQLESRS